MNSPLVAAEPLPKPRVTQEPQPSRPSEEPERLFNRAKELIRGRQFEAALDILIPLKASGFQSVMVHRLEREATTRLRYKKKVDQLIQASLIELKAGNLEKAEQKLSGALQLDQNNEQVMTLLEKVKNLRVKRDAAKAEVTGSQTIVLKEPVQLSPADSLPAPRQALIVSVTNVPPLADFLAAQD